MDCPSLDIIKIDPNEYPKTLETINITLRGKKNLFDIYFSVTDIENSFDIVIPLNIDFTWISTSSGRDKYLSYPSFKRFLFSVINKRPLASAYMQWIDSILFGNSKIKPFFKLPAISDKECDDETMSEFDDTESLESIKSVDNTPSMFNLLKQRIVQLEHEIEIKNKDIDILNRDVLLRDKEIEILQLKLNNCSTKSEWI